jgi:hypothetical protein
MRGLIVALLLAVTTPMPNGGPPLDLPANWIQATPAPNYPASIVWNRAGTPPADYPVRVVYSVQPGSAGSYKDVVEKLSKTLSCASSNPVVAAMMPSIGCAIVDRKEQCEGHPAHRYIRTPLLGHQERIAITELIVPWRTGFMAVEYDRPASELSYDTTGRERTDPVLDAMRKWCEAAASSQPTAALRGFRAIWNRKSSSLPAR